MSKKLNILHWPSVYPDPARNNPFLCIFVEEHIKSLLPYCNNHVLYASSESTLTNKWHERVNTIEHGISVTRYYFNKRLNLQFLNIYIRLVLFFYFIEIFTTKKSRPDLIHIHLHQSFFGAKLYARLFKIPIVITEHWSAFLGWPNIGEARYKKAGEAFKFAIHVLCVSDKIKHGITNYTGVEIAAKTTVINNAVDDIIFQYKNNTTTLSNQIVFIGRNAEEKDIPSLLAAFKIVTQTIPDARLHMIGSGDYYDINELLEKNGIVNEVKQYGPQNKSQISEILKNSNLLVLTSIIENSPCVIGEAHCCGLPVVATDVGGVKELIIEGAVVPSKSPELLAEKIIEQLGKPINNAALAKQAQARFGYDAIGQQILNVYENVKKS